MKRFMYVIFSQHDKKARNGRWVRQNDINTDPIGVCMTKREAQRVCAQHNKWELKGEYTHRHIWYVRYIDVVTTKTFKE